jgi:hypothetical protein
VAEATLRQIDERITEIDSLLFKGITGQIPMIEPKRLSLEAEATELMKILAAAISERGEYDYATAYEEREKVRRSFRIAAITARHVELHPEPDPRDGQNNCGHV